MTDPTEPTGEEALGRDASRPLAIPSRGWKEVLVRVKREIGADRVGAVSGSVAFFGMLAIFPALIALVSVYGLIADPADVQAQVASATSMLPSSARELLVSQLEGMVGSSQTTLGFGVLLAVVGALWSSSSGMKALMEAINVAYDETEKRGFLKLRGQAILLTLGSLVVLAAVFGLLSALPQLFERVSLGGTGEAIVRHGRWPLMGLLVLIWLSVLYRHGPSRNEPKWRWVSWGALLATALWLGGTALFSFYVGRFGSYNETYGAIGGVIVFMLWLYLSAFAVLVGAELNSELEHQTAVDSTVGEPKPMGERRAVKADTIAPPLSQT